MVKLIINLKHLSLFRYKTSLNVISQKTTFFFKVNQLFLHTHKLIVDH